jgi:uncharacterized protein DUF4145
MARQNIAAARLREVEASGASQEEQREPLAREGEHVAPAFQKDSFHCMHCGVLAGQDWVQLIVGLGYPVLRSECWRCRCYNCGKHSFWIGDDAGGRLIDPMTGGGPRPHPEMPQDVKTDYEEARAIVNQSPRGACALLRFAVQELCVDLGESGKDLNKDIGSLVKKGLSQDVQEAMDSLRVIGNNAVHPLEMDLRDGNETASALFDLLNFVVEDMIARPKKRRSLFQKLPQGAREAIKRRDQQAAEPD